MVYLLQYGISVLVAVQIGEVVTAVLTRKGVLDVYVQPNLWREGFKYLTWEAEGGGGRGRREEGRGERKRASRSRKKAGSEGEEDRSSGRGRVHSCKGGRQRD